MKAKSDDEKSHLKEMLSVIRKMMNPNPRDRIKAADLKEALATLRAKAEVPVVHQTS